MKKRINYLFIVVGIAFIAYFYNDSKINSELGEQYKDQYDSMLVITDSCFSLMDSLVVLLDKQVIISDSLRSIISPDSSEVVKKNDHKRKPQINDARIVAKANAAGDSIFRVEVYAKYHYEDDTEYGKDKYESVSNRWLPITKEYTIPDYNCFSCNPFDWNRVAKFSTRKKALAFYDEYLLKIKKATIISTTTNLISSN